LKMPRKSRIRRNCPKCGSLYEKDHFCLATEKMKRVLLEKENGLKIWVEFGLKPGEKFR